MKEKEIFLAADSGGSKTIWVLIDSSGKRLKEYRTKGLGAVEEGILPVGEIVEKISAEIREGYDVQGIYLSLGGPNVSEVSQALKRSWPNVPVKVEREACGDAILYAASFLGCSAVVMCGTGSTAIGDTENGRCFSGGWGPIYGDGGSGGGMGRDALCLFLRSLDGMDNIGQLCSLFSDLTDGLDVKKFTGRMEVKKRALGLSREYLASMAPQIYHLAEQGDETAVRLYREAAEEIASMAYSVSTHSPEFSVLLCGGFFKNKPYLLDWCKNAFAKKSPAALCYNEKFSPIIAAEIAVLRNHNINIDAEIWGRIFEYKNEGTDGYER